MNKEIRLVRGQQLIDKRKFYIFKTMEGQLVETKAVTEEEARNYIETQLETKLRRAA